MKSRTDEQMRIYLEVNSELITETGCRIWLRGIDKDGYGQVSYRNKNIRAHRLAYKLAHGDLDRSLVIMHICDTPSCINPLHLRQATQEENNNDKLLKRRHRVASGDSHYMRRNRFSRAGEKCPTVKLTAEKVLEIRRLAKEGISQPDIADQFGVSRTCISAIVVRRNWQHI